MAIAGPDLVSCIHVKTVDAGRKVFDGGLVVAAQGRQREPTEDASQQLLAQGK
jgi:hypothetical protein